MGASFLGLTAVGWHAMTSTVWGKVVASILLASVVFAGTYALYSIITWIIRHNKNKAVSNDIPRPVARYLKSLRQAGKRRTRAVTSEKPRGDDEAELKSFGAYLGAFAHPATQAQRNTLSQWDVLVLDPTQDGVLDALTGSPPTSRHVLARLDMRTLCRIDASNASDQSTMTYLTTLVSALDRYVVANATVDSSSFTGVLLAGFSKCLHPAIVNEVARYLGDMGLEIWLELSYPDYLAPEDAHQITMALYGGLVYRNGTIRPDGDRQNFFQMDAMRKVMRAMAAQRPAHNPGLVMWDTVDDDKPLQYAVVTRTFNWCTFFSAICWIGHNKALVDAEAAQYESVPAKPLGALIWLKNDKNMAAHDIWRANDLVSTRAADNTDVYDSLSSFVPNIAARLRLLPPAAPKPRVTSNPNPFANPSSSGSLTVYGQSQASSTGSLTIYGQALTPAPSSGQLSVYSDKSPRTSRQSNSSAAVNPFSISSKGVDYTGLGCFMAGHEASFADFSAIRQTQQNLQDLNLLAVVKAPELLKARAQIEHLRNASSKELSTAASEAVLELLDILAMPDETRGNKLKVFSGLHSGFQAPETGTQYFGLYDFEPASECLVIYLSNKAKDRAGSILHTFLSSRQLTRAECFRVEHVMAQRAGDRHAQWPLSKRLVKDVEQMSPTEAVLFLRRLEASRDNHPIITQTRAAIEYQLMDVPTLIQLRAICSTGFLSGEVSAEELIMARLDWLKQKGCAVPDSGEAIALFKEIDARLYYVLMRNETDVFAAISSAMQTLTADTGRIDGAADIFSLAMFSAFRRLALDEMYLEVLDRNVYPNHSADQAGCFAENFGLGSRCDSFFDTTPRHVGRIIADRYRAYYMENQPPMREDGFTELPSAYFAMMVDQDPKDGELKVPFYYRITFFGIFALPALVDVMLLTTLGRGLYLTTYMSSEHKTMATTALMLSLLMSGSFGAWICSGGSYYFFSNAFPAMNYFILTRFVAGVAVTSVTAILGFIVVICTHNVSAALVFLFYFIMLSVYMLILNAMSIYQQPGTNFLSGRTTIIVCIPILFVSPIVTMFTGHDIAVYVPILSAFVIALAFGAYRTVAKWSTWYLNIPFTSDAEIIAWYRAKSKASASVELEKMRDNDVMPMARAQIHKEVVHEAKRWFFTRPTHDELVKKLAAGYASTTFLMQWYCKHKRSGMPLPYSTTWNLTLKAGMENMTNMQKGLKLHSAFLHWRSTGKDIWSGFLYFVVALLDKWIAIFTGSSLVGLAADSSSLFRLGIGFGLCYYLIGAVALDIVSQPLWIKAHEKSSKPLNSIDSLNEVSASDIVRRRSLYWSSLCKFFFLHLWGTALFAGLIWAFDDSMGNTIMFIAYIVAYSGLLWYQYNKIYCGTNGALPLAIGVLAGLPVGLATRLCLPWFGYSGVICLGTATWVSCFASLFTADMGWPPIFASFRGRKTAYADNDKFRAEAFYTVGQAEPAPKLSQATMHKMYQAAQEEMYRLEPSQHPGQRVLEMLTHKTSHLPASVTAAFPQADDILAMAHRAWKDGRLTVDLVSHGHLPAVYAAEARVQHIVRRTQDRVQLFVVSGSDVFNEQALLNMQEQWRAAAEAIVQATAEHLVGLSHHDAMLAGLLVACQTDGASTQAISVPDGLKLHLKASSPERARVLKAVDGTMLNYALLNVDLEREWDTLPQQLRRSLLRRKRGDYQELTHEEMTWLGERFGVRDGAAVDQHLARCELGAQLMRAVGACALEAEKADCNRSDKEFNAMIAKAADERLSAVVPASTSILQKLKTCLKFLIISLTADPEYQRELNYVTKELPGFIRWPVVFFLNGLWGFCKLFQNMLVPLVLFHGRDHVTKIRNRIRGMTTTLEKNRIVTESFAGPSTWFWTVLDDGHVKVSQYSGALADEPNNTKNLQAINTYTHQMILQTRQVYGKGSIVHEYAYDYEHEMYRLPMQRRCTAGKKQGEVVQYDERGYVCEGSELRGPNRVTWKLYYCKSTKYEDELLWAEYVFPHITIKVLWSMPPRNPQKRLDEWIPFPTVTEATFIQGDQTWHASWDYEHKFHPEVAVMLNGNPVETPLMIKEDWFHVLDKPENCSFLSENPLLSFSSLRSNFVSRFFGLHVRRYAIPTSVARTQLWKSWKNSNQVDAISARWLDEKLLRSDKIMRKYWRLRDWGRLDAALAYLESQVDTVMANVDIDPHTSAWTHLAYKMSDFYSFGQGGDSRINTRKLESQLWGSEHELHVLAMDTSTWPNDPGGVSACRRDMVNDLNTIKWHVVAESANDYGVPRFQIERNVQSLTILPLWGLDFLNPTHGVLESLLDSAVVQKSLDTKTMDIVHNFLPILTSLVECARAINLDRRHVEEATSALVDLNTYFEKSRNWNDVWQHPVVKQKWRELWLTEMPNTLNISQFWEFEKPTIRHMDEALNLWCRYLFIFSLPVPEVVPDVFQASHHFTGATYGIVCKAKRNCSLHIWDHCISFREFTNFMSSAVSYDSPFVNSSLISLTHLSCVLLEHHADVVLPCCDYFNPGWEVELGTAEGALEHRNTFARKIDPVVNGICNMEKFEPIKTIKTSQPTVVMLSHIQYAKDIKNAIMATDMIVNKWGFKDYRLHIYGDQERAATIATECQELIAKKNLQSYCILKGLGSPSVVLQDAWLFLNSSISEGLPLAMGEAALTGVPVVCTDVGASYCVVTDRESGDRFSEVVSPNDAESLARAQISVMGLLGPWAAYAEDAPGEEAPVLAYPTPTPEQVKQINDRMYAKQEQRRALGMRGRENVLKNFSADRYLLEHEQMLWVGKYTSPSHRTRAAAFAEDSGPESGRTSIARSFFGAQFVNRSRPASRLTPESWISLTSEETIKDNGWSNMSSSANSIRTFFRDKSGRLLSTNTSRATSRNVSTMPSRRGSFDLV